MKYIISLFLLSATMYVSAEFGALSSSPFPAYEPEGADDRSARIRYEFERLADPATGTIPSDIHEREMAFVSTLPTTRSAALWMNKPTGDVAASITLDANWVNHSIERTGGRTRTLAVDAGNENVILAGGVGGGIWRSTDAGSSWRKTTTSGTLHSVSCVAQDVRPSKRSTWYYGTGELFSTAGYPLYQYDIGEGIFKSNDGGNSWVKLASTSIGRTSKATSPFHFVHSLATDPTRNDSDVVYAACVGGIMRSNDGGASWKNVLGSDDPSPSSAAKWSDVVVTKTGVVYAALSSESSTYRGIWRSTNGTTWQKITPTSLASGTSSRIRLALAPSNPNVVWLFSSGSTTTVWKYTYLSGNGSGTGGLWENRGASSSIISTLNTYGTYCLLLAVSPANEDNVIIGGSDLYYTADGFKTASAIIHIGGYSDEYLSTRQWDPINPDAYLYKNHHPDMHTAVFLPSNPNVVITSCDGGIFRSNNINQRPETPWVSLNNGYNVSQFYSVSIDPVGNRDGVVIGGAQDNNSSVGKRNGKPMKWILGGDGMICEIAGNHRSLYPAYQGGQVYRVVMNDALDTITNYTCVRPNSGSFDFTAPLRLDPNDDKILYMIGSADVWRNSNVEGIPLNKSTNSTSQNWRRISLSGYTSGSTLSAFGIATTPKNRVYAGTRTARIIRIDNTHLTSGFAVSDVSGADFPAGAFTSCVTVDPADGNSVFVAFSNYGVRSLFHSSDGGSSWEDISGNLEEKPDGSGAGPGCKWFDVLHFNNQTLYMVGTTAGLFTTTKLEGQNTVWKFEESIGNVNINMIRSRSTDGFVAVATHGLGIFSTYALTESNPSDVEEHPSSSSQAILHPLYPNPCYSNASVHYSLAQDATINLALFDIQGRRVLEIAKGQQNSGEHSFPLDVRGLEQGAYFCRLEVGRRVYSEPLTVVR